MSLDVIGKELQLLLIVLGVTDLLEHELSLLLHCFLDTDYFMVLMLVSQNAINAQNLQILFAESLQLFVVIVAKYFGVIQRSDGLLTVPLRILDRILGASLF